jgi:hypothetical protein
MIQDGLHRSRLPVLLPLGEVGRIDGGPDKRGDLLGATMDKVRDIFSYFVTAMTMFAFLGAVYQGFNNQKASALTLGTLFLIGGLFVFLPQVEFIKTLGVEARLRATVNEATVILEKIKRLSAIGAEATYMQMAWTNRMGTPSAKQKQAILDEVDQQINDLKVSPEERAKIVRPFVRMIGFDFYMLFTGTIRQYAALKNSALVARASNNHNPENTNAVMLHSDRITAWSKRTDNENPFERLETYKLPDELESFIPKPGEWFEESEIKIAERFKDEVLKLYQACEAKGGFTPEAADYYDRYAERQEMHARELFGQLVDKII